MLNGLFRYARIIIAAILALILSRMGIGYLVILVALGFILSFISKNKWEGVVSGVLYATLSYVLSYPAGLYLKEFMPNIEIPVYVDSSTVILTLLVGWLIPVIIAIIVCACSGVIGKECSKLLYKDKKDDNKRSGNDYVFPDDELEEDYDGYEEEEYKPRKTFNNINSKDMLSMSPIQRAKIRKREEEKRNR